MKLYAPKNSYKTQRLIAVAELYSQSVTLVPTHYTDRPAIELLRKYPTANLPALQVDNRYLFGCGTITRYLSNQIGKHQAVQQSLVSQWLDFTDYQVDVYASALYLQLSRLVPIDEQKQRTARSKLGQLMKIVNTRLQTQRYLAGERLTVADIALFSSLAAVYGRTKGQRFKQEHSHLQEWFKKMSSSDPISGCFRDLAVQPSNRDKLEIS